MEHKLNKNSSKKVAATQTDSFTTFLKRKNSKEIASRSEKKMNALSNLCISSQNTQKTDDLEMYEIGISNSSESGDSTKSIEDLFVMPKITYSIDKPIRARNPKIDITVNSYNNLNNVIQVH